MQCFIIRINFKMENQIEWSEKKERNERMNE